MTERRALLALEDGALFAGRAVGAAGEATGEVVFNTAMTGYQEILTDPSYSGQLVCLTYPLIGNYGVNEDDPESRQPWTRGLIVRELAARHSNWRATGDLGSYLKKHGIVGIDEVDTRALTRHLRLHGAKTGVISTVDLEPGSLVRKARAAPKLGELDLVRGVTAERIAPLCLPADSYDALAGQRAAGARTVRATPATAVAAPPDGAAFHVVAIDAGAKHNIMRHLAARGCRVTVAPATASAADISALEPDGLFLSNGPGDPEQAPYLAATVRELLDGHRDLPVFGICLGLQIMSLALGANIYKLKFGHHGANHPVREERTGVISITSQNHGYAVDADSLPPDLRITHVNLNDGTVEGLEHRSRPVFAIQYHPEAAPGPHDAQYLFDRFVDAMEQHA
jgi:carbamoyl-phosphate synthase small subunit